jgi:alkylation response protein AidB-like acyl-CoA dehydrogenase
MNEELLAVNELAADFAKAELAAATLAYEFPYARPLDGLLAKANEAGLFSVTLPAEHGGVGLDAAALAGVVQTLAAVDAGFAAVLLAHAAALEILTAAPAHYAAAAEGALAFPVYAAPGETDLPVARGDAAARLTGTLPLVVLGGAARHAVVPAATGDGRYAYFWVDLAHASVARPAPALTLGLQLARPVDLVFRDTPATRIGSVDEGAALYARMHARMAPVAAALALGTLEGALGAAVAYTRGRPQGGRNIVDWSGVRMKLAEMAVQVEAGRALVAGLGAAPSARAAVAAFLHVSDLAAAGTVDGVQLLGGNGYMKEYGQEKRMRDARQARSLFGMNGPKKLTLIASLLQETPV